MVAVGIGAGIIIVVMEVVYYRRKGIRKEHMSIAEKCADKWKATTAEAKIKRITKQHSVNINGVNGIEMNGNHSNIGYDVENDVAS